VDSDEQLALYEIAVRKQLGHAGPVRLVWHYLAHGKALTSARSPEDLAGVEGSLLGRVLEVLNARETGYFPPTPGPLCYYCSHKKACMSDYRRRGENHPVLGA
jgi:putative RecB family exonuclease